MKLRELQRLLTGGMQRSMGALLLAGGLLASCSDAPADKGEGQPFDEGEHPVVLTAAVAAATRATADDAWSGGEQVAVEAVPVMPGEQSEVKIYTASDDGGLTSADPLWWKNSAERKNLRAWYCGDGSSAAGGANNSSVPTEWSVASDQRGEGYQQSDLLFAPATEAAFAGDAPVSLRFYHQTAKVVVNIKKTEYATDVAQLKAVRIGDGDLILSASFTAPAAGAAKGTWETGDIFGTIEPRKLDAPTDADKYVATYEALVIPQPTAGKCLLTVETDLGMMYYDAPADAEPLEPGKVRNYNITVHADRLEVEELSGGEWQDGGSEEVQSRTLMVYTADDLKIGDYFYADGTYSDGGLRGIWSDGNVEMANPKPAPVKNKTVVGIVFQTDKSRIGAKEKEKLGGEENVHGLVMSVKNAATGQPWSSSYTDENLPDCVTKADNYNDISGYGNCELISSKDNNIDNYPAFKAANGYNTTCPVPATTTGWYLPASGQWWDIFQNLGGCTALADKDEQTSSESGNFAWFGQGDILAALNTWMEKIGTDSKNDFVSGEEFWSSSEYSDYRRARFWYVYNRDRMSCFIGNKYSGYVVRPVLAF